MKKKFSVSTPSTAVTRAAASPRRIATASTASRYRLPRPEACVTPSSAAITPVVTATATTTSTALIATEPLPSRRCTVPRQRRDDVPAAGVGDDSTITRHGRSRRTVASARPKPDPSVGIGITIASARSARASSTIWRPVCPARTFTQWPDTRRPAWTLASSTIDWAISS